jgi:hypothetical protein
MTNLDLIDVLMLYPLEALVWLEGEDEYHTPLAVTETTVRGQPGLIIRTYLMTHGPVIPEEEVHHG